MKHHDFQEWSRGWIREFLATLLLWGLLLGFAGLSQAAEPAPVVGATQRPTLTDLPLPLQYTISGQFGRDDPAYHFAANAASPQAANPHQGLTASFNPAGLRVQADDIDWNLTLTGWGRGEALIAPTADVAPVRRTNRVEYVHGLLTAWYVNGPMGLQQGWTVQERPAGEGDLTLALHSQGLSAQVEANGRSLKLSDDHGATRLHYGGLLAVDATGREMPVRFIVEGEQVRVAVNDAGAAYPLIIDPWIQQTVLGDSSGGDGAPELISPLIGSSVAMSANGDTIVVGAPHAMYFGSSSGVAYVYQRPAGGWSASDNVPSATLSSDNGYFGYGSQFGQSVAISADGGTIVVGAPYQYPGGAVYKYNSNGGLIYSGSSSDYSALLGYSVAVSANGDTVVAGAPGTGGDGSGAITVYLADTTEFVIGSGGAPYDFLGNSVAISADGNIIVAGAPGQDFDDDGLTRHDTGAARVFVKGTDWLDVTEEELTARFFKSGNRLGQSVAMNATGDKIVAGAPGSGAAAYVFVNSAGVWTEDARLTASGDSSVDVDVTVAINPNGDTIVAGAPGFNAAYVFVNSAGGWTEDATLTALSGNSELGGAVAIASDGTIATGARFYGNGVVVVFGAPVPAAVESITPEDPSPTSASYVYWAVTFDHPVSGLTASNFALVPGGSVSGGFIDEVYSDEEDSDTLWWVGVDTGKGSGTLGLNMVNDTGAVPNITNVPPTFEGEVYTIDKTKTAVSIYPSNRVAITTNAASVSWTIEFSQPVQGLTKSNFTFTPNGVTGVTEASWIVREESDTGTNGVWIVTANTGSGNGTLDLSMVNGANIKDADGAPLTVTNALPVVGGRYTINRTTPTATVVSVATSPPTTTSAASVSWTVTFSQAVTGVATSHFELVGTGISGASITGISGSGATRTVTANTGVNGTLGLNMANVAGINPAITNTLPVVGGTYTIDKPPLTATVVSIATVGSATTPADSVSWTVIFSEAVTGVAASNFALAATGVSGASITGVTGSGATWTVTANTGSGNGTLGLNMTSSGSIAPAISNLLFTGQVYTINKPTPTVTAITRINGNPTSLANVDWIVTFSQPVTGVAIGNFTLVPSSGVTNTSITNVTGSGDTWTVTASTGSGAGTLRLDMISSSTVANLPFTGQVYTIAGPSSIFAVTWSGSQFVAVGSGGLIRTSADGANWTDRNSGTTDDLYGIAWSGQLFVGVGDNGTLLTSADGVTWATRTTGTTQPLFGAAWSGGRFMVVGGEGVVLTSTNGLTWSLQQTGTNSLFGVSWSGSEFTAMGGNNAILPFARPWGDDKPLTGQAWAMIGLPATPDDPGTVESVFGASLTGVYGTDWVVWERDAADQYVPLAFTDLLKPGTGYWIKKNSADSTHLTVTGVAPSAVTTNANCPSLAGCYEIALTAPSTGDYRYNLVGMPFPYPVGWWEARLEVTTPANQTTLYTLDAAQTYVQGNYWIWDGNDYAVYDSVTPGMVGLLQPWQGVWIKVYAASQGHTLKLLVPAMPKYSQAPPAAPVVAQNPAPASGWSWLLDWLIAPAAAEPVAPPSGLAEREASRAANNQALQTGQAWYVRLIAEEPTTPMQTRNSVLGQLPDSLAGYDAHDLPKLAPFGQPWLSVAFPHPDWGKQAGDYASDYRPNYAAQPGLPADTWRFEIRTDQAGYPVRLRWEGSPAVLARSELVDEDTGARYPASDPGALQDGIPATMTTPVRRFTWIYAGQSEP